MRGTKRLSGCTQPENSSRSPIDLFMHARTTSVRVHVVQKTNNTRCGILSLFVLRRCWRRSGPRGSTPTWRASTSRCTRAPWDASGRWALCFALLAGFQQLSSICVTCSVVCSLSPHPLRCPCFCSWRNARHVGGGQAGVLSLGAAHVLLIQCGEGLMKFDEGRGVGKCYFAGCCSTSESH